MSARSGRRDGAVLRMVAAVAALFALAVCSLTSPVTAHPLGNFTVNQFARLAVGPDRIRIRYVIDMAEIATLQQLQALGFSGDGRPGAAELATDLDRIVADYLPNLVLSADGRRVPLDVVDKTIALPPGAGGLPTLRVEMTLIGAMPAGTGGDVRHVSFADENRRERIGWREIIVEPTGGSTIFDSSAFGNGLTDELKAYPQDRLAAPLREDEASFSVTLGAVPANATPLRNRDGRPLEQNSRDALADLIAVPDVTPWIATLGLLVAAGLGALHAFAPGHGKTIVGAYLVGAHASLKHAVILGATVTITHTIGVLLLGLVTLFASRYVLPEQLFPALSLLSGALVVTMGVSLLASRIRGMAGVGRANDARSGPMTADAHSHSASNHHHHNSRGHTHHHHEAEHVHAHGGREHSHAPPSRLSLRGLLALGISGGLLPCPSALVVLLSAVALHRIGYGLLLVVAFGLGLSATLTGLGLLVIFAGRWIKEPASPIVRRLARVMPAVSAVVITIIGIGLCCEAAAQVGVDPREIVARSLAAADGSLLEPMLALVSLAILALGLMAASRRG